MKVLHLVLMTLNFSILLTHAVPVYGENYGVPLPHQPTYYIKDGPIYYPPLQEPVVDEQDSQPERYLLYESSRLVLLQKVKEEKSYMLK